MNSLTCLVTFFAAWETVLADDVPMMSVDRWGNVQLNRREITANFEFVLNVHRTLAFLEPKTYKKNRELFKLKEEFASRISTSANNFEVTVEARFAVSRLLQILRTYLTTGGKFPEELEMICRENEIRKKQLDSNVDHDAIHLLNVIRAMDISPKTLLRGTESAGIKLSISDLIHLTKYVEKKAHYATIGAEILATTLHNICADGDLKIKSSLLKSWKLSFQDLTGEMFSSEQIDLCRPKIVNMLERKLEAVKEAVRATENWWTSLEKKYHQVCGDSLTNKTESGKPSNTSNLTCFFDGKPHSSLILNPRKVEMLSENPTVYQLHESLTEGEIQYLISAALDEGLNRSMIVANSRISELRTSRSVTFNDTTKLVQMMNRRSSSLTGLDTVTTEKFQINSYAPGEHFHLHHDAFYTGSPPSHDFEGPLGRIATLMYYLSDVQAGGITVFPKLGVSVKPRIGSAVYWENMLNDGSPDFRTLHGGCPVLRGYKWIAVKWFNMKSQMFRKPCKLDARN